MTESKNAGLTEAQLKKRNGCRFYGIFILGALVVGLLVDFCSSPSSRSSRYESCVEAREAGWVGSDKNCTQG